MSTTEVQTPPPRGLSRLRGNKSSANQSTSSLVSTTGTSDEHHEGGLKATLGNVLGKVRKSVDDRRESVDGGSSPQRRLSTIFNKKKNNNHRASQHLSDSGELDVDDGGSRSDLSAIAASRSSSLLTDYVPGDEGDIIRPTLSAHPSHQGFLTLSSPAVTAAHESDIASDVPPLRRIPSIIEPVDAAESGEPAVDLQKSTTFPISHEKSASATPALQSASNSTPNLISSSGETWSEQPILNVTSLSTTDDRPETPRLRVATAAEPATPPSQRPETPQTFVTPPTPVLDQKANDSVRRRRALSGSSKLSKSITVPLTPTAEEAKTPGGTIVQPGNATGFFSTVFSAAQKAADTLTSTINASPVKSKEATGSNNDAEMPSSTTLVETSTETKTEEEAAAARAVSNAYNNKAEGGTRPASIASNDRRLGDHHEEGGETLARSGSVRSRLSARRHRGSSAATASGVVSALKETLTHSTTNNNNAQGHRVSGFAVASKKRNKDFHTQFRSVPEDDYLIEDYSAALQRDILLHGRLYVSEGHICFSSNILGWVTNLVMSFDEIVSVEKKSTAVIFPNALVIQTVHAKNTFASFVARDSTYELIIGIWKINHPHLRSSLNGAVLEDSGTGDKTEKADSEDSEGSESESDDEFYDEDADDDPKQNYIEGETTRSVAGSDVGDSSAVKKKPSKEAIPADNQRNAGSTKAREVNDSPAGNSPVANSDSLGPDTHAPTECGDTEKHYDRALTDTTIPAPLGKIYSLMWGPGSGAFMSKWLVDDQKSRELDLKDDKVGLDNDHESMTFSYIKPLSGSVGPKQTKCITTNTLELFDLQKAVIVSCSTQTPDVPSGNAFATKTRYCLMWGPDNSTRLIANCTIEWSGKSWLKGPIEKGAQDGQTQYVKDLVNALKAAVSAKTAAKGPPKKGKKNKRKDSEDDDVAKDEPASAKPEQTANWGPLEPVRGIFEPIVDLVKPFFSAQVIVSVLFVLLIYTWWSPPRHGTGLVSHGLTSSERIAAYEELWHREESGLWEWLEDRVGLDDSYAATLAKTHQRQQVVAAREMGKKLDLEKLNDRELDEWISTTEDRLGALKQAVQKKRGPAVKKTNKKQAKNA